MNTAPGAIYETLQGCFAVPQSRTVIALRKLIPEGPAAQHPPLSPGVTVILRNHLCRRGLFNVPKPIHCNRDGHHGCRCDGCVLPFPK